MFSDKIALGVSVLFAATLILSPLKISAADLQLERVVLVQRHGVRSPTQDTETLKKWAEKNWPDWGIATGYLTPHGKEVVALVAKTLRNEYRAKGLIGDACKQGAIVVWADRKDQRTRESGATLAQELAPAHCNALLPLPASPKKDPVFNSIDRRCSLDPEQAIIAVAEAVGAQEVIDPPTQNALDDIQAALAPNACQGGIGTCLNGKSKIVSTKDHLQLTGPLDIGSAVAEIFLLEYAQGMPVEKVAWGHGTSVAAIERFMPAHERADQLTRQLEYLALRRGSRMARLIVNTLNGMGNARDPVVADDVKLLALAGHDTNLSNMAGVFGLELRVEGQPDSTAPATALAFELWRDVNTKTGYIKPRVFYLKLAQMRSLEPEQAHDSTLVFKHCSNDGPDGLCRLEELSKNIEQRIPKNCP